MYRKKYLIVVPTLSKGGAESMAFQYGKYLDKKNVEVTFLLAFDKIDEKHEVERYFYIEQNETRLLNLFWKSRKFNLKEYDRIISIIPLFTILICLSHIQNLKSLLNKTYFTVHNPLEHDFKSNLVDRLTKFVYLKFLKRGKAVFGVSKGVQCSLINRGIKSFLLYNSVTFKPNIKHNVENLDYLNILMVGRLTYQKGYDRLASFIGVLDRNKIKYTLDIYGEGDLSTEIKNLINIHSNRITLYPYRQEIENVFENRKYNCFLLLSRYEGFGLVLLEAIYKGLYCISTSCPTGPKEILNLADVGFLINEDLVEEEIIEATSKSVQWNSKPYSYRLKECEKVISHFEISKEIQWLELTK